MVLAVPPAPVLSTATVWRDPTPPMATLHAQRTGRSLRPPREVALSVLCGLTLRLFRRVIAEHLRSQERCSAEQCRARHPG